MPIMRIENEVDFAGVLKEEFARQRRLMPVKAISKNPSSRFVADLGGVLLDGLRLTVDVEDFQLDDRGRRPRIDVDMVLTDENGRKLDSKTFSGNSPLKITQGVVQWVRPYARESAYSATRKIDPKPTVIDIPVMGKVRYEPKETMSTMFWNAKGTSALMSWYKVEADGSVAAPGETVGVKTVMGFVGGHHTRDIEDKVRLGRDPVKTLEDYANKVAPRLIEKFIKKNFKKLVEIDSSISKALQDYYAKPGYKGD